MKCVYILESIARPRENYVGLTGNLDERFTAHNAGRVPHTSKYLPWKIRAVIYLEDDAKAVAFERYLKTGSGPACSCR